jgi:hypothetical protein
MSAFSCKPPIPRPAARRVQAVPALAPVLAVPASTASFLRSASATPPSRYVGAPAVIRDRLPTLEVADEDVVVEEPFVRPRPTPPPPLPARRMLPPQLVVVPPSKPAPRAKLESALDPTDVLFDCMYELNFIDSTWQAGSVCAGVLGRALGARAVVIHAHDLQSHELRTIGTHGDADVELLGAAVSSDDDLIASAVICNEKAVTMRFDGELPRHAPHRLGVVGAPRTLVAVPGMAWGRCVAIIEVIDADERLASRVADSTAYVAERLAQFLSAAAAA